MDEPEIIMPIESTDESIERDLFTIASCWALILPGWWIGSSAAQWIGGMLFSLSLLARIGGTAKKHRMPLTDAKRRIDAMIAERAK